MYRNGAQTHFADSGGSTAFHLAAGSQIYKYVYMNVPCNLFQAKLTTILYTHVHMQQSVFNNAEKLQNL